MFRRIGRILFLFVAAASLGMCLAALALWGWSYPSADRVVCRGGRHRLTMWVDRGNAFAFVRSGSERRGGRPRGWAIERMASDEQRANCSAFSDALFPRGAVGRWGFGTWRIAEAGVDQVAAIVPVWSIVALTAVLPLSAAASIVRRRRRALRLSAGHCPACGYHCRARPARCSECGRVFAAGNAAAG